MNKDKAPRLFRERLFLQQQAPEHQRISIGGTSDPRVRQKNTKKKTQGLEILSEGVLRTSRRAQRRELPQITIFLYSQCLPTPPELRDRSIWSFRGGFYRNFTPNGVDGRLWRSQVPSGNLIMCIRYLGAQLAVGAHTLQLWSTDQYYRTGKYQLHRTTGDGDTSTLRFSDLKSFVNRIHNATSDRRASDWMFGGKIQKVDYLHC